MEQELTFLYQVVRTLNKYRCFCGKEFKTSSVLVNSRAVKSCGCATVKPVRNTTVKPILSMANTSGYKGVCYCVASKKFRVRINVNNKQVDLGCFDTAIQGAKAYNKYVTDNHLNRAINII